MLSPQLWESGKNRELPEMKRRNHRRHRRIQWWQIVGFLICLYYLLPSFSNAGRLLLHSAIQPALERIKTVSGIGSESVTEQTVGKGGVRFVPFRDDTYIVDGSQAIGTEAAKQKGQFLLTRQYKEFIVTGFPSYTITDSLGVSSLAYSKKDIDQMQEIHEECQRWCETNMPAIVEDGEGLGGALMDCVIWIADYMSYDQRALEDEELSGFYQNAAIGFATGRGVCTTYTTMFNTMMTWLPINPETLCVDYETEEPIHIDSVAVGNDDHIWSMLYIGGSWKQYDLTFFDGNDQLRDTLYLSMGNHPPDDGEHNITTDFTEYYVEHATPEDSTDSAE